MHKEILNAGLLFKAVDGLRFYAKQEHHAAYHYSEPMNVRIA
ncbi:hypothetical protein ACE1TH_13525 [Shouchella sp. JSM 1781072]